jgi:predicted N-acetyltransferase YhbS
MERSHDMLVNLARFHEDAYPRVDGVTIRRAYAPELEIVAAWTREHFTEGWASEIRQAFMGQPKRCIIALKEGSLIGICAYDSSHLGVAGPLGVDERARGLGVGSALIQATMVEMKRQGYRYAILGWIAPETQAFYAKAVGAEVIAHSEPEVHSYPGLLRRNPPSAHDLGETSPSGQPHR